MTTTDPTGPLLLAEPCWMLAGSPLFGDGERHWTALERATADMNRESDADHGRHAELTRAAVPCRIATAACGYTFDEEGDDGIQHLPSDLAEAEEILFDSGWVRLPDGQWACGDDGCQCIELLGDAARPRPRPTRDGAKWTADRLEGVDV